MDIIEMAAVSGIGVALIGFIHSARRLSAALPHRRVLQDIFAKNPILIIEPNKSMRIILVSRLKGISDVVGCSSFEVAIQLMQNGLIPSCIIMETPADNEDGMNFIQCLVNNKINEKAKIIMLSRISPSENNFLKAYKKHVDLYFEKPFEPLDLERNILKIWKRPSFSGTPKAIYDIANPMEKEPPVSITKRFFDFIISLLLIILMAPVFLAIMIAIKLDSAGPIFYRSKRTGRYYRIFNFIKFRTMSVDSDKKIREMQQLNQHHVQDMYTPKFFKIANDPRVSRVGRFLRRTNLDELPQLFLVLTGKMSFVGNRPLVLYEASSLLTDEYAEMFLAPAGLLGDWQVANLSRKYIDMDVENRIGININYARKGTFLHDLYIIWIFIKSIFTRDFKMAVQYYPEKITINNPRYDKIGSVVKFNEKTPFIYLKRIKEQWMVEAG